MIKPINNNIELADEDIKFLEMYKLLCIQQGKYLDKVGKDWKIVTICNKEDIIDPGGVIKSILSNLNNL